MSDNTTATIFSEFDYENELHYAAALGDREYHRTLARIGEVRRLRVAITRTNFFKLDRVLYRALEQRGTRARRIPPPFVVKPLASVARRFQTYLGSLRPLTAEDGCVVEFQLLDDQLLAYLQQVQRVQDQQDQKALLISMGVVSEAVFTGPHRVLIDPSNTCNMDCVYCSAFSPLAEGVTRRRPRHLDLETIKAVIWHARGMGARSLSFVGGAEPTMVPGFGEIVREIAAAGLVTDISTNGSLLNRQRIQEIVDSGTFESITFSVSAASREVYERVHPGTGARLWERVMGNLQQLVRYKEQTRARTPHLVFLFAIYRDNFHEIEDAVRLAASLGCQTIWLQLLHVKDWSTGLALTAEQTRELPARLQAARQLAAELDLMWSGYVDPQAENLQQDSATWSDYMVQQGCLVGWYFSFVHYTGACNFCCGRKEIHRLQEFGLDYGALWRSDRYRFMRQQAKYINSQVNVFCDNHKLLFDEFCRCCDNHNFNSEVLGFLDRTGLAQFVDWELRRELAVDSPLRITGLEVVGREADERGRYPVQTGEPLVLQIDYELQRKMVHTHLQVFFTATQEQELVIARAAVPVDLERGEPGQPLQQRVVVDPLDLLGDFEIHACANVIFREGELERFYEGTERRVQILPRADPARGGGLIPLDHTLSVEPGEAATEGVEAEAGAAVEGLRASILDGGGQPVEELAAGQPYAFRFALRLTRPVADPLFRFQLYLDLRSNETFIFGTNNFRHGLHLAGDAGPLELTIEVPALDLPAGAYYHLLEVLEGGPAGELLLARRGRYFNLTGGGDSDDLARIGIQFPRE